MDDPKVPFRTMGKRSFRPTLVEFLVRFLSFNFPSFLFFKMKTAPKELVDFFSSVVSQTFEHRKKTGERREDFLQLLLNLKEKGEVDVANDERDEEDEVEASYVQRTDTSLSKYRLRAVRESKVRAWMRDR